MRHAILVSALAAGGAWLSADAAFAAQPPSGGGPGRAGELKIGVVNVDEIVARYRKAEELRRAAEEKLKARQEELATRSREFNRRVGELQSDAEASGEPERRKLARELEVEKLLLEFDVREFRREKQRAADRIRRQVADEVVAICRRLGRAEGFDLILRSNRSAGAGGPPSDPGQDDRDALAAFERNPVLFAAESVDLTSRVLEILEDAHRRGLKLVPGRAETGGPAPRRREGAGGRTGRTAAPEGTNLGPFRAPRAGDAAGGQNLREEPRD